MKLIIFIVAGEASGDKLGAGLMRQMREQFTDNDLEFMGIGGDLMLKEGLHSITPMEDLAVMGYWEVLNSIPKIYKVLSNTVKFALEMNPDIVITIDSPGFNFRFVKRLRRKLAAKSLFIHYVSPSIWAYRYKRIFKVQKLFDHILLLFPFEKRYYDDINFPSTFVGHPVVEDSNPAVIPSNVKQIYQIPLQDQIIVLMPGSRRTDLKLHLPVFNQFMQLLRQKFPHTFFVIPTVKQQENYVRNKLAQLDRVLISSEPAIKNQLMSIAKLAIVKSGTSSLEMMHKRIPLIVGYRVSKITEWLLKYLFKLDITYVSLGNIILQRQVIPELLQADFTAENLLVETSILLEDNQARDEQLSAFNEVMQMLGEHKMPSPNMRAAQAVKKLFLQSLARS